ncbi:hypothetical protein Tco_0837489 [Tanacetum coccineum]
MIQPEPEDLPKDNPKLEIAVLRWKILLGAASNKLLEVELRILYESNLWTTWDIDLEICYIDVFWPCDGSIDDLEVFGLRLEVDLGTISRSRLIIGAFYLIDFSFDLLLTEINNLRDTVMSDSEDSTVTYTAMSSSFGGLSDIGSSGVDGPPLMPEDPYAYVVAVFQALPSPDYVPGLEYPPSPEFVPELAYPEFMPPEDEDPEVDPADYPADGGDDGDDEDESSDDDEDDDVNIEGDEEEEHPAPADSTVFFYPAVD